MIHAATYDTLKNGFRIAGVPMADRETVTILVGAKTGWRAETPEQKGLAHLLEHLLFRGTNASPTDHTMDKTLGLLGNMTNATTEMELTYLWIHCGKEDALRAVDALYDLVATPSINTASMALEKNIIYQETMNQEAGDGNRADTAVEEMAFAGTAIRFDLPRIHGNLAGYTDADLAAFYAKWFVPGNMAAAVAGGGDIPGITRHMAKVFGSIPEAAVPSWTPCMLPPPVKFIENQSGTGAMHTISLAMHGFGLSHREAVAQDLVVRIFGTIKWSRLFSNIRKQRGLAYDVYAENLSYSDIGLVKSFMQTTTDHAAEVMELLFAVADGMIHKPITASELELAQKSRINHMRAVMDDSRLTAIWLLRESLLLESYKQPKSLTEETAAVTLEDIRSAAKEIFGNSYRFFSNVGPAPLSPPLTEPHRG
jgi:predicted Zn-dependent peptidase